MLGGAYGGGCSLARHSGVLSFSSYRDPNLGATLSAFDASGPSLAAAFGGAPSASTADDLRKAAIATIGAIDAPMSPVERGDVSAARYLSGACVRRGEGRGASLPCASPTPPPFIPRPQASSKWMCSGGARAS